GNTSPLGALATNADGTTVLGGGAITTLTGSGDQTYADAIILSANTVLSGNDITLGGTVNADGTPRTLTVNTSGGGTTRFGGAVGGTSPLGGLTTNADGMTVLSGGAVATVAASGDQTYSDAVILGADVALSGNDVTFNGTVNSDGTPRSLTVNSNSGGVTSFNAAVGATGALAGLTTNADGSTRISGGTITTLASSGDQTYADAVILGADTTLAGNDITFAGTLDSDGTPRSVTVN